MDISYYLVRLECTEPHARLTPACRAVKAHSPSWRLLILAHLCHAAHPAPTPSPHPRPARPHLSHSASYEAWPDTWEERETREMIVSKYLSEACGKFDLELRFQPRHVKCVNALITTHRSQACDRVKTCVDHCFGFTIGRSERNIKLTKVLLPFNFHYKDVLKKTGPFENVFIPEICRAVAFEKSTSVGTRYPDYFAGMPATYIAYACALAHHIIFSYREGEYECKNLSVPVQQSIFRRALRFQITMQEKKKTTLSNIRGKLFDYCVGKLKEQPVIRHSLPEPEREWLPDEADVYVSNYAGDHPNGDDGNGGDGGDGDEGDGDVGEDEQEELDHINWEDELLGQNEIEVDRPIPGPSGISRDEDVEMENVEAEPEEGVDELAGDYGGGYYDGRDN